MALEKKSYIKVKTIEGGYETVYPITKTDNIELPGEVNLTQKINKIDSNINTKVDNERVGKADGIATLDGKGLIPLTQLPAEIKEMHVVENIAQLNAIQNKFEGLSVYVKDATDDPSVKSGGAFYIYDGNKFVKTAQSDTMNVVVDFKNIENTPTTLEGYGITDAIHVDQMVTKASPVNSGKILVLNSNGKLDADITGRANSTLKLDVARKIQFTGDVTGEYLFDGGSSILCDLQLISKGIRPGTYTKVTIDDKGRVIGVDKLSESDIPKIDWSKITGTPTTIKDYGITDQVMVRNTDQIMTSHLSLQKDPTEDLHAVNKKYVDALVQGLTTKQAVSVCVDVNIDLYGLQNINGVQLKENERVLLINQTNRRENGIYVAKPSRWERSEDANSDDEYVPGMFTFVLYGEYENCGFVLINTEPVKLGTSEIFFTQFSGASDILVGSGLKRTGNVISLESMGTPGTYTKVTIDQHGRVIAAKKSITEADISGGVSWNNINDRPNASSSALTDAVIKKHVHDNKSIIDKLSEDEEGGLLYDGKQIATGPGGGPGGNVDGTLTSVGIDVPEGLATGGIWFKVIQ